MIAFQNCPQLFGIVTREVIPVKTTSNSPADRSRSDQICLSVENRLAKKKKSRVIGSVSFQKHIRFNTYLPRQFRKRYIAKGSYASSTRKKAILLLQRTWQNQETFFVEPSIVTLYCGREQDGEIFLYLHSTVPISEPATSGV